MITTKTVGIIADIMAQPTPAADKLNAIGIEAICEKIAATQSLQKIADSAEVSIGSLFAWLSAPDRAESYARAREAQAEKFAADILAIADEGLNDTYIDENGNTKVDQDIVQRSRLRVDSRKWLASKMFPKRYGEKVTQEVTGANGGPVVIQAVPLDEAL